MDKQHLVDQLRAQIQRIAQNALDAAIEATDEARAAVDPADRQFDAVSAVELSKMARGQNNRRERALAELSALDAFNPTALDESAQIRIGAIVEIEDLDTGEGRTFFLAPAGAGTTLHGPDGDGHLTVVTTRSPIGSAVLGRRVGDVIDVTQNGEDREWEIAWVG